MAITIKGNSATLLDNVAGTTDGEWIDVRRFRRKTIHVKGTFSATVKIAGSCEPTMPANNDNGVQIGSDITAPAIVEVGPVIKWLKVYVPAYTSGSISAYFFGRED